MGDAIRVTIVLPTRETRADSKRHFADTDRFPRPWESRKIDWMPRIKFDPAHAASTSTLVISARLHRTFRISYDSTRRFTQLLSKVIYLITYMIANDGDLRLGTKPLL